MHFNFRSINNDDDHDHCTKVWLVFLLFILPTIIIVAITTGYILFLTQNSLSELHIAELKKQLNDMIIQFHNQNTSLELQITTLTKNLNDMIIQFHNQNTSLEIQITTLTKNLNDMIIQLHNQNTSLELQIATLTKNLNDVDIILQNQKAYLVKPGTIIDYAGTFIPAGYLNCDGAAYSRTQYVDLYAVISTTWGAGDGTTTFNVPNFNRSVSVGSGGTPSSVLGNTVSSKGGEEAHAQTIDELAQHAHDVRTMDGGGSQSGRPPLGHDSSGGNSNPNSDSIGARGGGRPSNIMQPSVVVLKLIKT